jgi:hypothetical protein
MLSPRLTNCPECANVPELLNKIDCKLAELGNSLYNNISYMLNQSVPASDIIQLIGYRRILQYKYINPDYLCQYSVNAIAGKVIRLTLGCVADCTCNERGTGITTTSTSTSTTSSTSSTTTTTTTCNDAELLINGSFDSNVDGWSQPSGNWAWTSDNGGSAYYTGVDEFTSIFQNILEVGKTYDVSLNLYKDVSCGIIGYIEVHLGTNIYGPFTSTETITFSAECIGNTTFAIWAQDMCETPNKLAINNASVKQRCSATTTTTTTLL